MTLSANDLQVRHGERRVLDVPFLSLEPGQVHALLGPNGAGKSTLLHALAGLERSCARRVHLNGRPLSQWDTLALARQRALMSQELQVPFDFSARDIVRMGRFPHSDCPHPDEPELVERCLDTVGALHLIDRLHQGLSGGEKARVQLARVLAQVTPRPGDALDHSREHSLDHTPSRWLLLDEPTAALDLAHQHSVMRLLRQLSAQGVGVVVVLHDLNLAQAYADQALVLRDGRLDTLGRCDDVLQPKLIQRIWGVLCEKLPRPGQGGSWLALSGPAAGVTP